jgi:hypothetical protein
MVAKHDFSDRGMNIRAARSEHLDGFRITSDNAIHANRYEPTPPSVLSDMLLSVDADLSQTTFVDLGSGKGRVLCLAAAYPFKRIIGVEFAEELHRAAQDNLRRFHAPWRRTRELRSILCDATEWRWPDDPLVIFLFNPFRAPVLGRVVENLEASLLAKPRPIHLLYYMPEHADVLDRSMFQPIARAENWIAYFSTGLPSTQR